MEQALSEIENKLDTMNTGKNRQAEDLKISINDSIQMARRNITSAFASNAMSKAQTNQGGES